MSEHLEQFLVKVNVALPQKSVLRVIVSKFGGKTYTILLPNRTFEAKPVEPLKW